MIFGFLRTLICERTLSILKGLDFMLRRSIPHMNFDPDIPVRSQEIRMPERASNHDQRPERSKSHGETALES